MPSIHPFCSDFTGRAGLLLYKRKWGGSDQTENALKQLNGGTLHLPACAKDYPDQDRLALRFERFKAAA